jgi:hypothetical protein
MSFSAKLLAYSAVASLLMSSSPVLKAENVNLEYKDYEIGSDIAKRLWGDVVDDVKKNNTEPGISVATVVQDGRTIEFTMMFAENMCSSQNCPFRIYEDGELVMDEPTCRNISTHAISASGRAMVSCGDIILLDRKM